MKPEDQNRFKEIMVGLGDYYKEKITKTLMMVYWEDFSECDINDFAKSVSDHRKDPDQGMFFPKTANLIKQMHGTGKQQARSIEGRAELAWNEITTHLQVHGPYKTFRSKDGVSLAAFHAVGGMSKLSTADYEKMTWIKKEFISMYDTYENTPAENLPQNIMGLEDLQKYKLDQQGKLTDILSIANDLIDKSEIKSNEASPDPLSEEERQKLGQRKAMELKSLLGMREKPQEDVKETKKGMGPSVVSADLDAERLRKEAALKRAIDELNKKNQGDL